MSMENHDGVSRTMWDYLLMALCVFVMVLLLVMASTSFYPDFREVYNAIRWGETLVISGAGIIR